MLLTRLPVAGGIATPLPLDLHVLGLPLAFILSQDQTLHCKKFLFVFRCCCFKDLNLKFQKKDYLKLIKFVSQYLKFSSFLLKTFANI